MKFLAREKSTYLLGEMVKTDFLVWEIFFPWLKSHFPSISQTNMYFYSIGQNFLSGQKIFCQGRWTGHKTEFFVQTKNIMSTQKIFCPGRWTGH